MDASTKAALHGSIAKWEAIVAGTGEDQGTYNCPLCKLFYNENCNGCPVAEATGTTLCDGSPYEAWSALDFDVSIPISELQSSTAREEVTAAAERELAFLRALLPKTPANA